MSYFIFIHLFTTYIVSSFSLTCDSIWFVLVSVSIVLVSIAFVTCDMGHDCDHVVMWCMWCEIRLWSCSGVIHVINEIHSMYSVAVNCFLVSHLVSDHLLYPYLRISCQMYSRCLYHSLYRPINNFSFQRLLILVKYIVFEPWLYEYLFIFMEHCFGMLLCALKNAYCNSANVEHVNYEKTVLGTLEF